jgi:hypothetical protein
VNKYYLVRKEVINATAEQWTLINNIIVDGAFSASPEDVYDVIGTFGALTAKTNEEENAFFGRLYEYQREAEAEKADQLAKKPMPKDFTAIMCCPFCDRPPYKPTQAKKNKAYTACANGKCPIFGIHIPLKQWQNHTNRARN